MTRADVAWQRGYLNEFGDREQLDRENVWQYLDAPLDGYSITFADDRVVSFTKPQGMPRRTPSIKTSTRIESRPCSADGAFSMSRNWRNDRSHSIIAIC